ncbi:MAG: SDR family NAD(P)-dependent oxidoreductase [Bryobacteraceae bacterium]
MANTVLITGGAGFIGSHVANELLSRGYHVRALDTLVSQVHGEGQERPTYLNKDVELILGDVRDPIAVRKALQGVDAVYHFVALVGVGQSMYQIEHYTSVNNLGTAVLMEQIVKRPVGKLVVASSMSIYGEGLYRKPSGEVFPGRQRTLDQLRRHDWEARDPSGELLEPIATPEWKTPSLSSVYALSKYDQEQMALIIGRAYGIPTIALRFFNVYGPYQALSNPYTGVLAIFAARLMNSQRPIIFEDGDQQRDFVSVYDIARACRLALEKKASDVVINIGSGNRYSIHQIAELAARALGKKIEPEINGNYRVGDIRHCFPDITLAKELLNYTPAIDIRDGLEDFASWLEAQTAHDRFSDMQDELATRGLVL